MENKIKIFVLDKDPELAAKYHCDKHVIKMILETAQILCTVRWKYGCQAPYNPTHINHPCVKWASESKDNYLWLCRLGVFLCREYRERYNKQHKSTLVILDCMDNVPNLHKQCQNNIKMKMLLKHIVIIIFMKKHTLRGGKMVNQIGISCPISFGDCYDCKYFVAGGCEYNDDE